MFWRLKPLLRTETTLYGIPSTRPNLQPGQHDRLLSLVLALPVRIGQRALFVCLEKQQEILTDILNAGSVFIGNYSPESAGDYASGTNHTLPTNGYARNFSGVNLDAFQKTISFQDISKEGLRGIGPAIELMAEAEGLQAHKNAVTLRLRSLSNENSEQ